MMRKARQRETQDDPCFPINPTRSVAMSHNKPTEEDHPRLLDTHWCNCDIMPTVKECLYCCEIRNVVDIIEPGTCCIVENPIFINHLYINLRLVKNMTRCPSVDEYHRYLRITAYRTFTILIHKFLGRRNRHPIPACVVKDICTIFADSFGLYQGFIALDDYEAVDFDLD
ncbi:hypothetical protein XELAEV_18008097mg [Xenopus laevis]|uniref:P2X purinoceptor 7-like n=1 Tax=Xenopus laevis TaxID=8355 RepID=A0A974I5S4_XENLA|nr:hypothetical protein XELAEV_18008097mg [Xenopus laevis]